MIKVKDNRKSNECQLNTLEVGKFFMYYDMLFRRCWWAPNTFLSVDWKSDYVVCMNMNDGEVLTISGEATVQPIADSQIELYVED